jgi:hypothetical protein
VGGVDLQVLGGDLVGERGGVLTVTGHHRHPVVGPRAAAGVVGARPIQHVELAVDLAKHGPAHRL